VQPVQNKTCNAPSDPKMVMNIELNIPAQWSWR